MTKRIKILFTIPNFDTAGSGKVVYDLVKGLDRSVFEPEICCFHGKGDFFQTIKSLNIPIHLFSFTTAYRPLITFPFRVLKIVRFFKQHQFDIIHSWHWSSDFSEPLAAKLAGIPFVYTKKSMGWGNRAWLWRSQLSTKIVTINSDMLAFFSTMKDKVVAIPLGIDTTFFKPLEKTFATPEGYKIKHDDFVIVSVANLVAVKGIEILMEAVRFLKNPSMKVFIVGDYDSDYGQLIKQQYENEAVLFLGKQQDVRPYLALADLFVIPTKDEGRKEGLPIAPIEAMASQRIVIGSDISGIHDILEPFPECLFQPNDVADLAKCIESIKSLSLENQKSLCLAMRKRVEQHYTLDNFVKHHEVLYQSLIKI
jgi:glycosyltransferase involved in cell wall biosynthesis